MLKTAPLRKGVQQAKWMHDKYRFHQNYLMLVVATDSERRRNQSQLFRYNKVEEKKVVYEFSGFGDLPENVGIFIIEINQPSINSINYTATIASKALRFAKSTDQMNKTTSRIQTFLNTLGD